MNDRAIATGEIRDRIFRYASESTPACIEFLKDLVALPSPSRGERLACERVIREMESLGYDEVRLDEMGNVIGRIGSGARKLAFDAHVDTVGITRPANWRFDPFGGAIVGETLYGRGASDQKGGLAAVVHGVALAGRVGVPDDCSLYVTATVNGEDCVGLAWQHLVRDQGFEPEVVIIAMPSHLGVCRGQRGRLEVEITTRGVSAHGSHPDRGVNAVVAMAPIVTSISRLHSDLAQGGSMLGPASVAVTGINSESPSLTAIPDACTIHVDRRLTTGETAEEAIAQLAALPEVQAADAEIRLLEYDLPSWRGLSRPTDMVFPAWETAEESAAFQTVMTTARGVLGREPRIHRSAFSSNGCATAGIFGIPTIGFGPADEGHSHTVDDQISLAQLQPAMTFYALFPFEFR